MTTLPFAEILVFDTAQPPEGSFVIQTKKDARITQSVKTMFSFANIDRCNVAVKFRRYGINIFISMEKIGDSAYKILTEI